MLLPHPRRRVLSDPLGFLGCKRQSSRVCIPELTLLQPAAHDPGRRMGIRIQKKMPELVCREVSENLVGERRSATGSGFHLLIGRVGVMT